MTRSRQPNLRVSKLSSLDYFAKFKLQAITRIQCKPFSGLALKLDTGETRFFTSCKSTQNHTNLKTRLYSFVVCLHLQLKQVKLGRHLTCSKYSVISGITCKPHKTVSASSRSPKTGQWENVFIIILDWSDDILFIHNHLQWRSLSSWKLYLFTVTSIRFMFYSPNLCMSIYLFGCFILSHIFLLYISSSLYNLWSFSLKQCLLVGL